MPKKFTTPKTPKPLSPIAALMKDKLPGERFRKDFIVRAAKILSTKGEEEALAFLAGKAETSPPNVQPPAKAEVIAQSRPFSEWPIVKVSNAIQRHIYGMTAEERKSQITPSAKAAQQAWFQQTGVNDFGFKMVQGLAPIFQHALARYDGVVLRTTNRNAEAAEKLAKLSEEEREVTDHLAKKFAPLPIFNETGAPVTVGEKEEARVVQPGCLMQPPGLNPNLYTFQQVHPVPYEEGTYPLPPEYAGYRRDPKAPILSPVKDRLTIPKGQPGYIPEWQRPLLSTKKNRRRRCHWETKNGQLTDKGKNDKAQQAILASIAIGEDWAVIDLRGLLRNAQWRKLFPEGVRPSVEDLLNLFTCSPVIDTRTGVVTFCYKIGVVKVTARKGAFKGKNTRETLERILGAGVPVTLLGVDLGQNNPVAAGVYRVTQVDGDLRSERLGRSNLPPDLLKECAAYRAGHTRVDAQFRKDAFAKLPQEKQQEILNARRDVSGTARAALLNHYKINGDKLPWALMSNQTTYISDALLAAGVDPDEVFFKVKITKGKNKGQIKQLRRRDNTWANQFKPRPSEETSKQLSTLEWNLRRSSEDFRRLSARKRQLCRQAVNASLAYATRLAPGTLVIPVIEDLNVRIFHGSGKRDIGWDNFFVHKSENRWFIQGLHKAFSELAPNRGKTVFEVCPQRTSQTCPACNHCSPDNRSGETFKCLACGYVGHADLDVATHNIVKVAVTGKALPLPPEEQAKKDARDAKKAEKAAKKAAEKAAAEAEAAAVPLAAE